MTVIKTTAPAVVARIMRGDEALQGYFARRTALGAGTLFVCPEAEEFNLALVDSVPPEMAAVTLSAILRSCDQREVATRVRCSPAATFAGWPELLVKAGFVETGERRRFWTVPEWVTIPCPPGIEIARARTPEDAALASAIQAAGYGFRAELRDWDRSLAQRHISSPVDRFYLARVDGIAVGAAASMAIGEGMTGFWGLATVPNARNRGIGSALLGRMIDDARALGAGEIFFATSWDSPIEGTYERLGFVSMFRARTFERALTDA